MRYLRIAFIGTFDYLNLWYDIKNTYFYILLLQLWTYPQLSRKYKIPLHFFEDRQER